MKSGKIKNIFFIMMFVSAVPFFAQENGNIKNFIKGNIEDKISAVKKSSGKEAAYISLKTVDFVLENVSEIGTKDREFNALAVTGILALPATEDAVADSYAGKKSNDAEPPSSTLSKLYKLFSLFDDTTIRISVIEKIVQFYEVVPSEDSVRFISEFLAGSLKEKKVSDVQKAAIISLGKIGGGSSFNVLYKCLQSPVFSQLAVDIKTSIENSADRSLTEILQIINNADVDQMSSLFNLIKNSPKISSSFKSEIAENILLETLDILKGRDDKALLDLEMEAFSFMVENNWTRASSLIVKFFLQSKKNYEASKISEAQFIKIINGFSNISTAESSKALTEYLGELNKRTEEGSVPSEDLMLAVVRTLGRLGSKTAFDQLLFVTYLDYPESVIAEARSALTKLKW
ncbi:hypothetical protein HRI96_06265 [Treponema parvum]|uniref:HEAT repeat domain-containing protein n=1 Tax=Treponema parvum TaxID=138851 RepID=A0A975EZV6_9SPIR|nr:hypothetical protein [Treponema parvum]QTQ11837.1 hypothetical protein HRI96_06265 [Treponema parvum]